MGRDLAQKTGKKADERQEAVTRQIRKVKR